MLTKEEAESLTILESEQEKMKEKEKEKEVDFTVDEESIQTVDEEDVQDHGSSASESDDEGSIGFLDFAHAANVVHDDLPAIRQDDVGIDIFDTSSNDVYPSEPKKARFSSKEGDELRKLRLKYDRLYLKSENFRKSADYWKARHNQSVEQSKVPLFEATKENVVGRMLHDIVESENLYMTSNWKRFTSKNKFRRYVAQRMWYDTHDIFVSLREFFFELAVLVIR